MNFEKKTVPFRRRMNPFGQNLNAKLIKSSMQPAILASGGYYELS